VGVFYEPYSTVRYTILLGLIKDKKGGVGFKQLEMQRSRMSAPVNGRERIFVFFYGQMA